MKLLNSVWSTINLSSSYLLLNGLSFVLICELLQISLLDVFSPRETVSKYILFFTHLLISTSVFLFQNFSSHYVVWYQAAQPYTCKEKMFTIHSYFPISQSNHCTDQYGIRPSAVLGLEKWVV